MWSSPGSPELAGHKNCAKPISSGLAEGPEGQELGTEQPGIQERVPGVGRVDLWLLNITADFGVPARVMLAFLGREVCQDPEEQL